MSYSLKKLQFFVDDVDGSLSKNLDTANQFVNAEDDREGGEMTGLMDPLAHFSSFWGVARGPLAALAVLAEERASLRITWTTVLKPITSHTFEREGNMQILRGTGIARVPIVGVWVSQFFQAKVHEQLVVRDAKVVFRSLDYRWGLGRY